LDRDPPRPDYIPARLLPIGEDFARPPEAHVGLCELKFVKTVQNDVLRSK
jgi:hypothetical protein